GNFWTFTGGKFRFTNLAEQSTLDLYPNSGEHSRYSAPGIFGQFDYKILAEGSHSIDIMVYGERTEYFDDSLYGQYVVYFPFRESLASYHFANGTSGTQEFAFALPRESGLSVFFRVHAGDSS